MRRVVLSAVAAVSSVLIGGCSLNSNSLNAGFNSADGQSAAALSPETRKARQGALGGEPNDRPAPVAGQKMAKLDDRAPRGTFDRASPGSLADRDYSITRLDAEAARDLINKYRAQNGLKPLKLNAELSVAAKNHSADLAKWDRISHFGSDGSNPWDRVKRSGYNARLAAENVGTGQTTIDEVFKGWKESPGHNKNLLLSEAEHMGIALVQDPKTEFKTFWTLVLGTPL
jgi:uncharacterized protein YkwD